MGLGGCGEWLTSSRIRTPDLPAPSLVAIPTQPRNGEKKKTSKPTEQESGWIALPVWTFRSKQKSRAFAGNRTTIRWSSSSWCSPWLAIYSAACQLLSSSACIFSSLVPHPSLAFNPSTLISGQFTYVVVICRSVCGCLCVHPSAVLLTGSIAGWLLGTVPWHNTTEAVSSRLLSCN